LITKDEFINGDFLIAVCGVHVGGNAVHVGIAWKDDEGEKKVIHFLSGNDIPVEDLENSGRTDFSNYFFNPIEGFNSDLIPSLSALSELISVNSFNSFVFNRQGVVYNGGKFEMHTGNFRATHISERIINCGVFVIGLLKTYDYCLIDWNTWPDSKVQSGQYPYLENWFSVNNIPSEQRQYYYNTAKEIRGKHVVVSPSTISKPSPYLEVLPLCQQLAVWLNSK
jgi:hypothetical protein